MSAVERAMRDWKARVKLRQVENAFENGRKRRRRVDLYVFDRPADQLIARALTAPAVELAMINGVSLGIMEHGRNRPHRPAYAAKRDPSGRVDGHYRMTRREWLERLCEDGLGGEHSESG